MLTQSASILTATVGCLTFSLLSELGRPRWLGDDNNDDNVMLLMDAGRKRPMALGG